MSARRDPRTPWRSLLLALALAAGAMGCDGTDAPPGPPAFSTADLAGLWHYDVIFAGTTVAAGTAPGWLRGTIAIDATGVTSLVSFEDSAGATALPALPRITYALSGSGIVTATTTAFASAHGRMNGRKTLFVTTATQGAGAQARARLTLFQRIVPGVTYGPEDVASTTYSLHQLAHGSAPGWLHAEVGVDGARVSSLTQVVAHTGPGADVLAQGTLSIGPDGVVTTSAAPSFRGFLSADKRLLLGTQGRGPAELALSVLVRRGATFAPADAAGGWDYHDLVLLDALDLGAWAHGAVTIAPSGVATFGPQTDSLDSGAPPPATETFALAADGTFTHVPADDFHGTVGPAKDLLVATDTFEPGLFGLVLALR